MRAPVVRRVEWTIISISVVSFFTKMENGSSLSFDALKSGCLGISAVYGSFLAEAASHCLQLNDHANPVVLDLTGDVSSSKRLKWSDAIQDDGSTWADSQEATEYGGYGVAIVVALPLTGTERVERSAKGTGIDYWIGEVTQGRGIFQHAARLEVSGILKGDDSKIRTRLNEKLTQSERSEHTGFPAYVVIVEFSRPEARFVKKTAGRSRE